MQKQRRGAGCVGFVLDSTSLVGTTSAASFQTDMTVVVFQRVKTDTRQGIVEIQHLVF